MGSTHSSELTPFRGRNQRVRNLHKLNGHGGRTVGGDPPTDKPPTERGGGLINSN